LVFKPVEPRYSRASIRAARARSRRRWFMRDIPRTYLLVVWLGFGVAILVYANDWHPSGWSALRHEAAIKPPQRPQAESYTGSIIIVPTRGDFCWQRMLDNRTGKMWDKGYVNCEEAVSRAEKEARGGMSTARINAIGKAFNGGDN
jgi:hypothetical protein